MGSVLAFNDEPQSDAFDDAAAPNRTGESPLTEGETSGMLEAGEGRAALSGSLWAGVEATRASLARTCEGSRQCCCNKPAPEGRKESAIVLRSRERVQRETYSVLSQKAQSSRSSAVRHSGVLAELDQGVVAVSVLEAEDRAESSVVLQDDLKIEAAVGQRGGQDYRQTRQRVRATRQGGLIHALVRILAQKRRQHAVVPVRNERPRAVGREVDLGEGGRWMARVSA